MNSRPTNDSATGAEAGTSRRDFLETTAAVAAGAALAARAASAASAAPPASSSEIPSVALGPHRVTRLIVGANPIYGHSHFNNQYSTVMTEFHTPERVMELLQHCQRSGINTWQNSFSERTISDVERFRSEGGRLQWLLLGKPDWDQEPGIIDRVARHRPIGIAPHGALAERLHRQGKTKVLLDLLKRIRQTGALVGLSTHNPALMELSEEKGWDVDYYMACLYYLTRPKEEFEKMLGEPPLGEIYLLSDREKMLKTVRAASKPCLIYKLLAAGRMVGSPRSVRDAFQHVLGKIKPTDAVIIGMWLRFGDQVAQNAALVREFSASSSAG